MERSDTLGTDSKNTVLPLRGNGHRRLSGTTYLGGLNCTCADMRSPPGVATGPAAAAEADEEADAPKAAAEGQAARGATESTNKPAVEHGHQRLERWSDRTRWGQTLKTRLYQCAGTGIADSLGQPTKVAKHPQCLFLSQNERSARSAQLHIR